MDKSNNDKKKRVEKKRMKKEIVYRSKEERKQEVKKILEKLNHFQLTIAYDPIKKLYIFLKEYINDGKRLEINIPFPSINRRIKGLLAISVRENVWINLQHEKF